MPERLRIGLLQAGYVAPTLVGDHGDYPALFSRLLGSQGIDIVTFDLQHGGGPDRVEDLEQFDGWIVSGSASSVYEDVGWIRDLEELCRALIDRRAPLVGICFGHQVIASATGGRVEHADVGWGVGVHEYHLVGARPPWVGPDAPDPLRVVASHQDQVTVLPEGATNYLTSDFCPNAGFTIGDRVVTMQAHPEFDTAISGDLLALRREKIGADAADAAAATLRWEPDSAVVAGWIGRFLRAGAGRA